MINCNENINVGIDLGSLYLKLVTTDEKGIILEKIYRPHKGNPIDVLKEEIKKLGFDGNARVAITGKNAGLLNEVKSIYFVDEIKSLISCVKANYENVRNIIDVGGGSCTLVRLDDNGDFQNFETNSMCAAGTGAFLDEQAERLGIDYRELDSFRYDEEPPTIAARCSVFAKSDLIHRQQEGYSKDAMWSGLCKSMQFTMLQTLLRGKPLEGLTILTGGVAKNKEVLKWLVERYRDAIKVFDNSHLASAIGVISHLRSNFLMKRRRND